ncbi:hypothetical protein GCM10022243_24090 [Saccharothrix violaceirubra]|uniref:DUF397 domain-containing protein n=1 Tax=Saccharothrix violaceirubra TaxID=413306 RepID=A0A7W7T785_9PSEU|nr:DUF397 domain-containing protein [Saccharothrix violaceirubra]MBB4967854.1 hypothetical protein [Saccharothrix violaceirubra]
MATWRKSSYSGSGGTGGGNCVEVAHDGRRLRVRDSKNPEAGTLTVSRAWLESLKTD